MRVGDVLEQPHHPDVVERLVLEWECESIGFLQRCLDPGPLEVTAGEVELPRLAVDAEQAEPRKFLSEHRQYCTHSAADLEQARSGRELRAVGDQPVPPVLRLLDEPLLLARSVAVNVVGHACRVGVGG